MAQLFKTIYFADHPSLHSRGRHVKIALGPQDSALHAAIRGLSSCELRLVLGVSSFAELASRAFEAGETLNAYCVRAARNWVFRESSRQLSLFAPNSIGRHCTYAVARTTPVNRWFPWLEGYSPSFVEAALNAVAPRAQRILDPFAGSGTTPLTAISLGRQGYYCEINPLLQLVSQAKALAFTVSTRRRTVLGIALRQLAEELPRRLAESHPDVELRNTYRTLFVGSEFFKPAALDSVLRMRRLLDGLMARDPQLGTLCATAAVAAILPSSLLKRAGDVRFRRGREVGEITEYVKETARRLSEIASDLETQERASESPVFLTADARDLSKIPTIEADAVVTSPPYLNGTNYFRNTKVELWFLRALRQPGDLAAFRARTVTAGINDVNGVKGTSAHHAVRDLVAELGRQAYDKRIPRMVGSYFFDMEEVLRAVSTHLVAGARLAIDIGDSVYAGVHVPTDELLTEVARSIGYSVLRTEMLRSRVSRDRTVLKQSLIVLEWPGASGSRDSQPKGFRARWEAFKVSEPHKQAPFAARNWGHSRHSLCSYQGKLKPSLAHHLVRSFLNTGERVLDPFGGVGTVALEAALQGSKAFSFDISPAAHIIATGKLGLVSPAQARAVVDELYTYVASQDASQAELLEVNTIGFNGKLRDYFHPGTMREIVVARRFFRTYRGNAPETAFVHACLLHILHGNRPYALSRRSHPITPFAPTGDFQYKEVVRHLRAKVERALAESVPSQFTPGTCILWDATEPWPQDVRDLDAIITSPPFFDSTRFYLANWIRLWFAGWNAEHFAKAPAQFVDERQKASFSVYEPIFRQARERLKPGAPLVMHLGRSRKCDMATELIRVSNPWFRLLDRYHESVRHCESHGIRDKGTVTDHEVLVLG